jgi:adenylate cyclase
MGSLARYCTQPTPEIARSSYRSFAVFNVGYLFAMAIHAAIIPLFVLLGAGSLARVGILSVLSYAVSLWLSRRGWFLLALALGLVELVVHQFLCVYFLGWASGFQYYLLAMPGVAFFLPAGRTAVKLLLVLAAGVAFALIGVWAEGQTPVVAVGRVTLAVLHHTNAIIVFCMLGGFIAFYARAAETAEHSLELERRIAEDLLHNILPVPIAQRLAATHGTIADGYAEASVMFADIVGFTPLAESMPPTSLVSLLDAVFSDFDDLVGQSGLEKIKTIGDAYMVAAGIPVARPDHAHAITRLAVELQAAVAAHSGVDGVPLRIRIGINSGPVVAGVIGKRKFIYDLWGDTVNIAARMESHGVAGEIQVSESTRLALGDSYDFVDRGVVEIKGKGPMHTWLLGPPRDVIPRRLA